MQFANPWWLVLLALPIGVVLWYVLWYRQRRLVIQLSYDARRLRTASILPTILKYLPLTLLTLALILLVLAMARPQTSRSLDLRQAEGIDIMLVLDISKSMETTDFAPNRLAVARDQAVQFIRGRQDDRIGLVVFAQTAVTLAPLTLDYDLVQRFLTDLRPGLLPNEGSAIGVGIGMALNRLASSGSRSKAIILLTDGKATEGNLDPIGAAKLAAEQGVRIYTIGVGKASYRLPNGRTEKTDLDEAALKQVADISGGRFYRAADAGSLQEVFSAIGQLERTPVKGRVLREVQDLYPQLLLAAFILLVIAFTLMRIGLHNWLEE